MELIAFTVSLGLTQGRFPRRLAWCDGYVLVVEVSEKLRPFLVSKGQRHGPWLSPGIR